MSKLDIWAEQTGINLNVIWNNTEFLSERIPVHESLPLAIDVTPSDFTFSIIAGKLPAGLRLDDYYINGYPYEVSVITKSKIVFRAEYKIARSDIKVYSVPIGHYLYINNVKYIAETEDINDFITQLKRSTTFTTEFTNYKLTLSAIGDNTLDFQIDYNDPTHDLIDLFEFKNFKHTSDRTYEIKIEGPDSPIWTTPTGRLPVGANQLTFVLDNSYVYYKLGAVDTDLATIQNKIEKDFTVVGTKTNKDINDYIQQTGNLLTNNTIVINGITVLITGNTLADVATDINFANIKNVFSAVIDDKLEIYTTDLSISISKGTGNLIGDTEDLSVLGIKHGLYQFDAVQTGIKFFIDNGDGELPPGLFLNEDGTIYGIVKPVLSLMTDTDTGFYDMSVFDAGPFDFGTSLNNGFDSFWYDDTIFDFSNSSKPPKKLNRNFNFTVTVTDGESTIKRDFVIYVVGDDFLTADNTIIHLGNNAFTADLTYLRSPVWLSPKNLGVKRANNYTFIPLELFDPNTKQGPILVDLLSGSLPAGLSLDRFNWEIYGYLPYQPAITKEYRFTLSAWRYNPKDSTVARTNKEFIISIIGEIDSVIKWNHSYDLGTIPAGYNSTKFVNATTTVPEAKLTYKLVGGILPPGLTLTSTGEIINQIRQFGKKTLTGYTTIDNGSMGFDFRLTTLDKQFPIAKTDLERIPYNGLTHVDSSLTTFDGGITYLDRSFYFGIQATDQFEYSSILGVFKLSITEEDDVKYTDVYIKAYVKPDIRALYKDFINDTNVFNTSKLYRPYDPNFGVQRELKMLIYAGIEEKSVEYFVSALSRNHKRKRLYPGNIKKAIAITPGTQTIEYEIIYLELVDKIHKAPLEVKYNKSITVDQIGNDTYWEPYPDNTPYKNYINYDKITTDIDFLIASNETESIVFPNSISNMKKRLKAIGKSKLQHLPLWMRSPQPDEYRNIGYVKAVPICYCLPGNGDYILNNVLHSDFNFNIIDFDFDRYIININEQDRYFVFPMTQFN